MPAKIDKIGTDFFDMVMVQPQLLELLEMKESNRDFSQFIYAFIITEILRPKVVTDSMFFQFSSGMSAKLVILF